MLLGRMQRLAALHLSRLSSFIAMEKAAPVVAAFAVTGGRAAAAAAAAAEVEAAAIASLGLLLLAAPESSETVIRMTVVMVSSVMTRTVTPNIVEEVVCPVRASSRSPRFTGHSNPPPEPGGSTTVYSLEKTKPP